MLSVLEFLVSLFLHAVVEPSLEHGEGIEVYTPAFIIVPIATLFGWGYSRVLGVDLDE